MANRALVDASTSNAAWVRAGISLDGAVRCTPVVRTAYFLMMRSLNREKGFPRASGNPRDFYPRDFVFQRFFAPSALF
jgi:hypothetical protein|tara:strand:- start:2173 stop:2406 length:234 start_codon:yes stop_codon:yes gene_type:complete